MTKGGMTRLVICDPTLAFAFPASPAASLAGPNDLARRRCRSVLVEASFSNGTWRPSIDSLDFPVDRRGFWYSGSGGVGGTGGGINGRSFNCGVASVLLIIGTIVSFGGTGGGGGVGRVGNGG